MTDAVPLTTDDRPTWRVVLSAETLIYTIILAAAIGLRWTHLGSAPLSNLEAKQAMAAWHLVTSPTLDTGAIESPLIFVGALIAFVVVGASNTAARFLPMLAGVALVCMPLAFRRRLGRLPTLIASAWLAISPVAVAASRRISGVGLSMLALMLALAALDRIVGHGQRRRSWLVGAALGLALLADYGALVAAITLGLGFGFALLTDEEHTLTREVVLGTLRTIAWPQLVAALLGTVALLGTAFFVAPWGLGAVGDQLSRFVAGFARPIPGVTYPGVVLPLYETTLLVFGLVGAWLASQSSEPWRRWLAGWGVAAVIVGLIYRGSMPEHALWGVVPLAALAGLAVTEVIATPFEGPRWGQWAEAAGVIATLAIIGGYIIRHLQAPHLLTIPPSVPADQAFLTVPLDLVMALMFVVLLIVLWLTAASFLGTRSAWRGAALGILSMGLLLSSGASGSLVFSRATSPYEPLNVAPAQPALDDLVHTMEEIGELTDGFAYDTTITVQGNPEGSLAWALRSFNQVEFVSQVDPQITSVMVITPTDGSEPTLGSNYVGQDFVIERSWVPEGMNLGSTLRWIIYRTAPTLPSEQRVVLWVREDIYQLVPAGGSAAP